MQQARLRSARQESWVQGESGWLPVYTCQRPTVATRRFMSPSYHSSSEPASLMTTATIKWPISCYFIRNTVQSPTYNVRCNQISHKKKDKQLAGWCTNIVITSFKMENCPQAVLGRLSLVESPASSHQVPWLPAKGTSNSAYNLVLSSSLNLASGPGAKQSS